MLSNMPVKLTKLGQSMSVSITNNEPGSITKRCSSKDNDLQLQTLGPGAVYVISVQHECLGDYSLQL
jgi:hypothetical protein